jgi:hypothetical protein
MKIDSIQKSKNEISKISTRILDNKLDVISGLRMIYGLLSKAHLDKDENYNTISAIVDETELVAKGEPRSRFSKSYLEKYDQFEKEYLEENKLIINEVLNEFSKIPIVEEPDDLYAWPFEEYK